jgi:hypothetical protein
MKKAGAIETVTPALRTISVPRLDDASSQSAPVNFSQFPPSKYHVTDAFSINASSIPWWSICGGVGPPYALKCRIVKSFPTGLMPLEKPVVSADSLKEGSVFHSCDLLDIFLGAVEEDENRRDPVYRTQNCPI